MLVCKSDMSECNNFVVRGHAWVYRRSMVGSAGVYECWVAEVAV